MFSLQPVGSRVTSGRESEIKKQKPDETDKKIKDLDPFSLLPDELQVSIFGCFNPVDLLHMSFTSKAYYKFIKDTACLDLKLPKQPRFNVKELTAGIDTTWTITELFSKILGANPMWDAISKIPILCMLSKQQGITPIEEAIALLPDIVANFTDSLVLIVEALINIGQSDRAMTLAKEQPIHKGVFAYAKIAELNPLLQPQCFEVGINSLIKNPEIISNDGIYQLALQCNSVELAGVIDRPMVKLYALVQIFRKVSSENKCQVILALENVFNHISDFEDDVLDSFGYFEFLVLDLIKHKSSYAENFFNRYLKKLSLKKNGSEYIKFVKKLIPIDIYFALKAAICKDLRDQCHIHKRLLDIVLNGTFEILETIGILLAQEKFYSTGILDLHIEMAYGYVRCKRNDRALSILKLAEQEFLESGIYYSKILFKVRADDVLFQIDPKLCTFQSFPFVYESKSMERMVPLEITTIMYKRFPKESAELFINTLISKSFDLSSTDVLNVCEMAKIFVIQKEEICDIIFKKIDVKQLVSILMSYYSSYEDSGKLIKMLHDISPFKTLNIFIRSYKELLASDVSTRTFENLANFMLPYYPEIAIGLLQKNLSLKKTVPSILKLAELVPEHRVDILKVAFNKAKDGMDGMWTAQLLQEVAKAAVKHKLL